MTKKNDEKDNADDVEKTKVEPSEVEDKKVKATKREASDAGPKASTSSESTSSDSKTGDDGEKKNKIEEKLKTMGFMSSKKQKPEEETRRFSPMLITILIAIPLVCLIIYLNMPDKINNFVSSFGNSSSESVDQTYANNQNQPAFNPNYPSGNNNNQFQQSEWAAKQRAEMDKRRAEMDKHRAEMDKRRAEMDKRRAEYQKRNVENYQANWANNAPPEPPQWVKDRQAEIEKEMAKQQQEWSRQPNWAYNRGLNQPGFMRHPRMNGYQQNNNGNVNGSDMQAQPRQNLSQNQNPANAYPPNQRQRYNTYNYPAQPYFYNRPYYGPRHYNAPYGWGGPAYR